MANFYFLFSENSKILEKQLFSQVFSRRQTANDEFFFAKIILEQLLSFKRLSAWRVFLEQFFWGVDAAGRTSPYSFNYQ